MPVGLGVLLDVSDSMFGQRIVDARTAVEQFLFTLLNPADEFFVTAFNHAPRALTPWTATPSVVSDALNSLRPSGGTAIYDAVISALPQINRRNRQRAALLIISDGADTASDANLRDVRGALLRSDAFVYAIAIDSPPRLSNQRARQPLGPERDHGSERRPDGSGARRGRPARRDGAHRRGAEQSVSPGLFLTEQRRRQVPQHPRVDA